MVDQLLAHCKEMFHSQKMRISLSDVHHSSTEISELGSVQLALQGIVSVFEHENVFMLQVAVDNSTSMEDGQAASDIITQLLFDAERQGKGIGLKMMQGTKSSIFQDKSGVYGSCFARRSPAETE